MGNDCVYAALTMAQIVSVDTHDITFTTRCEAPEPDARLLTTYTVKRTHVAEDGFSGGPAAVRLARGEIGALYLDRDGWKTTDANGRKIFNADNQVYKWPRCGDSGRYTEVLAVKPSRVELRGQLEGSTKFIDIDLWNPAQAESAQVIEWDAVSYSSIVLAPGYAQQCGVSTTVAVFPTDRKSVV